MFQRDEHCSVPGTMYGDQKRNACLCGAHMSHSPTHASIIALAYISGPALRREVSFQAAVAVESLLNEGFEKPPRMSTAMLCAHTAKAALAYGWRTL